MTSEERPTRPAGGGVAGLPWYPAAFAAAFVLNIFAETHVSPFAMLRSLALATVGSLLVVAVAWLVRRDRHKAGLIGLLALVVVIAWKAPLMLGAVLGLGGIVLALLPRTRLGAVPWPRLTRALNLFGCILLVAVALKAVTSEVLPVAARDMGQGGPLVATGPGSTDRPPDIYAILLDGYPRQEALARLVGYDNGPFLADLEERGFEVAAGSRSNYAATMLSLASMLNMAYLEEIPSLRPVLDGRALRQPAFRDVTNENAVFAFLRERGYQIVVSASGFEEASIRRSDVFLDEGQLNEFEVVMARLTALEPWIEAVAPDFVGAQHRSRVLSSFAHLRRVAATPSDRPRLVFAHVASPHAPVVFDAQCGGYPAHFARIYEYVTDTESDRLQLATRYGGQIECMNRHVIETIDAIQASSIRPPVILLFSDHGSLTKLDRDDALGLRERVTNFFAAATPGAPEVFPEDISLVNVFPRLFSAYFGAALPDRPNRSLLSFPTSMFDFRPIEPEPSGP